LHVYLSLKKLINKKYFPVKEKFSLIFRKVFSFYFEWKILFRSYEKIRNIILFTDYNKFAIYFVLNFFLNTTFTIWFYLIFILTLIFIFFIVISFSLIIFFNWFFYLSNLVLILLIIIYFIWNNLWNCNYYYFNFIIL
jgi:hypothetical protein